MEKMNYVSRAKELMLKTARTTALVIVPLAAAVSAHAGSIVLPTGNPACFASFSGGSCPGGDAQLADPGNGIAGVSLFMNSGSQTFFFSSGSGAGLGLALTDSGSLAGGSLLGGTNLPVGWNFTLGSISGSIGTWTLMFELGSTFGGSDYGSVTVSGSGAGTFTSPAPTTTFLVIASGGVASGSTLFEEAILTFSASTNGGPSADVEINVPSGGSFDFNSTAGVTTPEPGAIGIMGAGLAFLGAMLRRRKK
jgi:hypothetical protein